MAATIQMKALHEVRYANPSGKGLKTAAPGTVFPCPEADVAYFESAGAAERHVPVGAPAPKPKPKPKAGGSDAEREGLMAEAQALGLKPRSNATTVKLREMIDAAKAAQASGPEGSGEDAGDDSVL